MYYVLSEAEFQGKCASGPYFMVAIFFPDYTSVTLTFGYAEFSLPLWCDISLEPEFQEQHGGVFP